MQENQQSNNKGIWVKIIVPILIVAIIGGLWLYKNSAQKLGENASSATQNETTGTQNLASVEGYFPLNATEEIDLGELTSYGLPIVIDFGADSCVPCKEMAPVLKKLNEELAGQAIVRFVDVWKYQDAIGKFPVTIIPTQFFFNGDGTPYVPSEELQKELELEIQKDLSTGKHNYTSHKGGLTEEQLRRILSEMDVATASSNSTVEAAPSEPEQTEWLTAISDNANAGKYTLLFIDDGKGKDSNSMKEDVKAVTEKLSNQFVFIDVDYTKSQNSVLKYLNTSALNQFPLVLSIAPSGLICGGFDAVFTEEELSSTITTGTKEEILLALQNGKITVITIHNGQHDKITTIDSMVMKEAKLYDGCVVSYSLDSTNEADAKFIQNLPETNGEITLMVAVPPGSITSMLTDDEVTAESIAAAILSASQGGGCGCS